MSIRALALVATLSLTGCTQSEGDSPDIAPATQAASASESLDVTEVARTYAMLTKLTPEPVDVNPELSMLCRGASAEEVTEARKVGGPHAHSSITIYMSGPAARAFHEKARTYPVGSVIVKEKEAHHYHHASSSSDGVDPEAGWAKGRDGVGGMIKRAPGYDPGHGDWEYFYFEDPAKVETGRIASCVQCHAGAAGTDHVYGQWAGGTDAKARRRQ
jgi:hypothetical protein